MNKGFTLIELLIVLAIVGILASIGYNMVFNRNEVSWGMNGAVETRCVGGYKTNVTAYSSNQVLDENGRGIPCSN